MNKAKEILYKHAKSNGCKSDLLRNPFLEQAVLNAINEALTIPTVVGQSEQLVLFARFISNNSKLTTWMTSEELLAEFKKQK